MTGGRRTEEEESKSRYHSFLEPSLPPADDRGDEEKGEKEVEAFFSSPLSLSSEGRKGV